MKKIFTLCTVVSITLLSFTSKAQFSENFDTGIPGLTGNCWQIVQMEWTNASGDIINGLGSLNSNPPVNNSSTRDIYSPALNITSTSLTVSFSYMLTSAINGNATRTIEVGLVDVSNNFTSLQVITLDKYSPTGVQYFNNTFTVSAGIMKLVIKSGGKTGDGNTRLIIDDLWVSADPLYGPGNNCNSAPIAVNDVFTGIIGMPFSGNVMLNDIEPNGETMTAAVVLTSNDGALVLNPDGSFTFTPNNNFNFNTTTFTYRLTDNGFTPLISNTATVTINFSATLPVHLISFQGNMDKNSKVTLQWRVADNETVNHFAVQRSSNGRDFTTIAVIFATEKTGDEDYMYYETVKGSEKVMYRLRMIDREMDADYSKILVFQNISSATDNNINILGNPVNDRLTFSFQSASTQTVEVKIYDLDGRLQLNSKVNSYEGSNMVSLPLSSTITPGFYVVEVSDGTERHVAKFVKQ